MCATPAVVLDEISVGLVVVALASSPIARRLVVFLILNVLAAGVETPEDVGAPTLGAGDVALVHASPLDVD